jgi:predicted enzyme related to lactoylglutathione lyase
MNITDIACTDTPVTDMPCARAFYEGVLGLKPPWKPSSDGTCVAFEVGDFDAEISQLKSKNVPFAMGITNTPLCRFTMISDPDGNKILIHKRK